MFKRIAFVDDEEQILRALKRLFFGTEYECIFVNQPNMLLEYLKTNTVDILVTDIRMPDLDGIELMRRVRSIRPEIIRVALSGYTDSRQIIGALDTGLARLYIYKPWDNDELKKIIDRLSSMMGKLHQESLRTTINGLGSLPTFPALYRGVLGLIEKEANASEIAGLIETDPAIASKLLRIANTAYYGSHTGSVQQAIMMLGMTNVRQIILTNAIFDAAEKLPYGKLLWRHAAVTNKAVAYLYQTIHQKPLPSHVGVVGLMHTIGLLFLATIKTSIYKEIVAGVERNLALGNQFAFEALEKSALGASHWEVGSFLLNWWELPFDIVEAAYHYRRPIVDEINNHALVAIVHLVSHMVLKRLKLEGFNYPLNESLLLAGGIESPSMKALDQYLETLVQNEV